MSEPNSTPSVAATNISRIVKVDTESHLFLDKEGRRRLFRGVNVVFKKPPYHPSLDKFDPFASFTDEDARLLRSLSLNSIRLAVHWAGLEPTRGQYSTSYINAIRTIMRTCAAHGIYVLLEFHQDVLAPQFCGHGFPDWVVQKDWMTGWRGFPVPNKLRPFETGDDGVPSVEQCESVTWYKLYFTFAVADAFGKFYSNHSGTLDAFTTYWQHVAQTFKSEPNLLGYELINEPWPGNHYKNPLLLIPGHASKTILHAFHTTVATAIRSVHPNAIIFFEGTTWDTHSQAPSVPGGEEFKELSVLSYHYYKPPQTASPKTAMKRRVEDADRLGCGLFLTEWENWYGDGSKVKDMWETVEAADEYLQSWHGWSYKTFAQGRDSTDGSLFDEKGGRRVEIERLWSRTWAPVVAGVVREVRFDRGSGEFFVRFVVEERRGVTVVSLVQRVWYPDGFVVLTEPEEGVRWSVNGDGDVEVEVGEEVTSGTEVKVTVQRGDPILANGLGP
ncbi:hypothetical protein HK097_011628 [Rhizophlyctis rosea]|uniref:Uncharacterized protein n=1 Tax=Rhizophlyctis rosea TaxID=64517 RepID=A0AAD5SNU7_9FUNG|nr:hypothetical protein HK097_011628 [Rhizophlyctis rosea]